MDWLITIPKTTNWADYQRELDAVADYSGVLNYRTRYFPRDMGVGDRCFIVHNGRVRGWMWITGLKEKEGFVCATTGRVWPAGKYIQRSGPFHEVDGPAMTGFRGVRRYDHES